MFSSQARSRIQNNTKSIAYNINIYNLIIASYFLSLFILSPPDAGSFQVRRYHSNFYSMLAIHSSYLSTPQPSSQTSCNNYWITHYDQRAPQDLSPPLGIFFSPPCLLWTPDVYWSNFLLFLTWSCFIFHSPPVWGILLRISQFLLFLTIHDLNFIFFSDLFLLVNCFIILIPTVIKQSFLFFTQLIHLTPKLS